MLERHANEKDMEAVFKRFWIPQTLTIAQLGVKIRCVCVCVCVCTCVINNGHSRLYSDFGGSLFCPILGTSIQCVYMRVSGWRQFTTFDILIQVNNIPLKTNVELMYYVKNHKIGSQEALYVKVPHLFHPKFCIDGTLLILRIYIPTA